MQDALAGAFLIFSLGGSGTSFLAFAIMAAKRGLNSEARGRKSLYYLGGLTEGTETILCFALFCLWPAAFVPVAWGFGALCWVTTAARVPVLWVRRTSFSSTASAHSPEAVRLIPSCSVMPSP